MTQLPQLNTNTALAQIANPHQLRVARELAKAMSTNQARELLATDLLYKVGNLALIQEEILKNNPEAQAYTDYILRAFTHYASEHLR